MRVGKVGDGGDSGDGEGMLQRRMACSFIRLTWPVAPQMASKIIIKAVTLVPHPCHPCHPCHTHNSGAWCLACLRGPLPAYRPLVGPGDPIYARRPHLCTLLSFNLVDSPLPGPSHRRLSCELPNWMHKKQTWL